MINGLYNNTFDRERIKENALTSKFQEFQVEKNFRSQANKIFAFL